MRLLTDFVLPFASLALSFLTGTLAGVDLAQTRRARRDLAEAERLRAAIRAAAPHGYEMPWLPEMPPRRPCANGPEHCLCDLCAPTEHQHEAA